MFVILPFFIGLIIAFAGVTPPGLINMTAAKISLQEGKSRAVIFAIGATIIILIQIFIAVLFARFIDKNPNIIILFREVGLAIFSVLTFYFFWTSKNPKPLKKEIKLRSKKSRFFLGILLSTLNLFPIPFYVFISITLASFQYFYFEKRFIYCFVIGSGLGSFLGFYCYIAFFKKLESKTAFLMKNMNYIIGTITGFISILTLINVIEYYYN